MPTLDWIGKSAVVEHHKEVPFRLLKCLEDLSVGAPDSGNLLIQGDKPGSAESSAAILRRAGEVHLHRPALQHGQ
jgi:hypothetical protein